MQVKLSHAVGQGGQLAVVVRVARLDAVRSLFRQLDRVRVGPTGVGLRVEPLDRGVDEVPPPLVRREGLSEQTFGDVDNRRHFS